MSKKAISLSVGTILVLVLFGSLAEGGSATVSPLNTVADLDLSGEIVCAINFGNGSPTVGGTVFSNWHACPAMTVQAVGLEDGGQARWWGPAAGTADAGLNELMNTMIYTYTPPYQVTIDIRGLVAGGSYLLQLIAYEPETHNRNIDITVENADIVTGLNPITIQGGIVGKGGYLAKYAFTAGDPILNVRLWNHENGLGLCGLILARVAEPVVFADYGSGTTTELISGKGTWQINWGQGPWTWSENTTALPLLGSNVSSILAIQTTAPAKVSADLVATLPIAGTLTLSARDQNNGNGVIGTMVLNCVGVNVVDLNAARVLVDQGSGMALAPFHPPGPEATATLKEATGVFAYVKQVGDWRLQLAGLYAMPLIKGVNLQDNIMQALGGKVPLIGGVGDFALTGQYEPVESLRPNAFCEYGTGVTTQFGAAGGLWAQTWTGGPWSWHKCPATANARFIGENVSGELETTTTGTPALDEDLVLRMGFGGQITLTHHNVAIRGGIDGQIIGAMKGTFVADANAAHATLDSKGNILCAFGVAVHDAPDALITITEATGIYADIHPAGDWSWYVTGTMTIARVVTMTVQENILAALQRPELLLGAQEEFVLTGWYYRQ